MKLHGLSTMQVAPHPTAPIISGDMHISNLPATPIIVRNVLACILSVVHLNSFAIASHLSRQSFGVYRFNRLDFLLA